MAELPFTRGFKFIRVEAHPVPILLPRNILGTD